jgi:septal ring factor EnvC (AmiA/AmiB activator)
MPRLYGTPELCTVPDLQCIMAAAHRAAEQIKRLQHAAAMLHCVRDTGTAACNPVNYRAGTTGVECKQQEKNRLPVKGEIYREPSPSIWTD